MTTATRIIGAQSSLDTDAEFRTDMLAIHNALIATGGLIQTADTGQTDFTANTRSAGGYTVYRFNDAHQSSYPLFLKIVWTPTSLTRQTLTIDVGTGSNGAGTITGVIRSAAFFNSPNSGAAAEVADNFVSVGDGYLYMLLNIYAASPNNRSGIFLLERSTDESGLVHPEEGVIMFVTGSSQKTYSIYPTGFAPNGPASSGSPFNHGINFPFWDDLVSTDVGLMPIPYMMRSKMRYHRMILMRPGRLSYGVAFDASHLGATRKFMSIENYWYCGTASSGWSNCDISSVCAFALPWV